LVPPIPWSRLIVLRKAVGRTERALQAPGHQVQGTAVKTTAPRCGVSRGAAIYGGREIAQLEAGTAWRRMRLVAWAVAAGIYEADGYAWWFGVTRCVDMGSASGL
jgi:hypothetical protein